MVARSGGKDKRKNVMYVVGGLATDYCVRHTVLDALKEGFEVTLLEDAIRGVNQEDSKRAIKEMLEAGATTATVKEV